MRPKVYAALLLSLLLVLVCALPDGAAHAQRRRQQQPRPAPQQAEADNDTPRRAERPKRVIVGGSSDTPQGSRQTIKSDNPLNDYSAYRSGDRFVVVLPKADAGSVARGASGRGFSDMQVQQRGDDVVLSYRLKPGAKPRVEQKFNRLDVVFDVPEGAAQSAAQQSGSQQSERRNQTQAATTNNRAANTPAQQQVQTPASRQPSAAEQQAAAGQQGRQPAATNAGQPTVEQTRAVQSPPAQSSTGQQPVTPPVIIAPESQQAGQSGAQTLQPAEGSQSSDPNQTTPTEAQTAPQEVAQAQQPPAGTSGAATTQTADAGAQTGTSVGAVVLNNWPIALALLLALVGIGLIFAARRSSALSPAEKSEPALSSALVDTAALKEADAKRAVKPAAANGSTVKSELKDAPAKGSGKPLAATEKRDSVASDDDAKTIEAKPSTVESETTVTAVAPVAAAIVASGIRKAEEEKNLEPAATSSSVASIEHDRARDEARRLLDGGDYDRALVGSNDPLARQLVSAELLSALSGGHTERRDRARVALAEHGYLDDLLRDVREASAPAERAAAARSLGLVGDRSATPRLASALEDKSPEVRRAAVEAFAHLRDPLAVPALEALIRREKKQKHKTSRSLVRKAIEASRADQSARHQEKTPAPVETGIAPVVSSVSTPVEMPAPSPVETETEHLAESATPELVAAEPAQSVEIESATDESATVEGITDESATVESAHVESVPVESARSVETVVADVSSADVTSADVTSVDVTSAELESVASEEIETPAVETEAVSIEPDAEVTAELQQPATEEEPSIETTLEASPAVVEPDAAETARAEVDEVDESEPFIAEPVAVSTGDQSDVTDAAHLLSPEPETSIESEASSVSLAPFIEETAQPETQTLITGEVTSVEPHVSESAIEPHVSESAIEPREIVSEAATVDEPAVETQFDAPVVPEIEAETDAATPSLFADEATVVDEAQTIESVSTIEAEHESEAAVDFYPSEAVIEEVETRGVEIEPVVEQPIAQAPEPQAETGIEEWVEFDLSEASESSESSEPGEVESGLMPFGEITASSELTPVVDSSPGAAPFIEASSGELLFDAPTETAPPAETPSDIEAFMPQTHDSAESEQANQIAPVQAESPRPAFYGLHNQSRTTQPPAAPTSEATGDEAAPVVAEKGIELFDADSTVPASIQQRLISDEPAERALAVTDLSRLPRDEAFRQICTAFDDEAQEVRSAAARALFDHDEDRAECFTRALREATPERRRHIGAAINSSGLASDAISQLTGESREKTYEAFSILFLMAKTGEVQPLLRAVEGHPNNEVRLAVVKLLALSGQKEILPAFRRLAVRGSLPTDVRSAVMEAIYQISSQTETTPA